MIKHFLTNDIVFKMFFKKKLNYLVFIINEILHLNIKEEDITFINNDDYGSSFEDKNSVIDMSITLSNGEVIIVEMQNTSNVNLYSRFEYYMDIRSVVQVKTSVDYKNKKKVYGIFFLNSDDKEYPYLFTKCSNFDTLNVREFSHLNKESYVINLTRLEEATNYNFSEKLVDFLKLLKSKSEKEIKDMCDYNKEYVDAYNALKEINVDEKTESLILQMELQELDRNTELRQAIEDATIEGRAKGLEQGIEQGIEQGTLEEKHSIAKNMLNKNMDISLIMEITNLTEKEILSLKD